jgi:hypothetical protein
LSGCRQGHTMSPTIPIQTLKLNLITRSRTQWRLSCDFYGPRTQHYA